MTLAIALGGCAAATPDWATIAAANPAPTVTASRETDAVATANADAADDPAIWRNAADPAASLIVGTDKRAGLHVYGLDGRDRHFVDAGRVNNVDLIETRIGGEPAVLVAASDRNDLAAARIALFRLDTAAARLVPIGTVAAGAGEAYGICLAARGDGVDAFMVVKDGTINQVAIDLSGAAPSGRIVRTMKLASQSEGCVVDPRTRRLYVAEEDVGIWRFDAAPDGATTAVPVARVDGRTLVADVEGLAIAPEGAGAGGWLIASSQGDNAFSVYSLADDRYVGRFRIAAGALGAVSETDGIEVARGGFGPDFPDGVMVAQDGDNAPVAQNFKIVDWRQVRRALGLR
ncbi:3-phytase [Sphingomonas jejuensis]|uniref:3-phytase n=1 Tax=Sphingomonas jejuensis TaxID=904715 RepID=A0ABX0XPK3_9SPHN|nr:phytase [Sphingomonas jejuensis]NJC34719.1 3-phytase [Sphingomonas jejuensis]